MVGTRGDREAPQRVKANSVDQQGRYTLVCPQVLRTELRPVSHTSPVILELVGLRGLYYNLGPHRGDTSLPMDAGHSVFSPRLTRPPSLLDSRCRLISAAPQGQRLGQKWAPTAGSAHLIAPHQGQCPPTLQCPPWPTLESALCSSLQLSLGLYGNRLDLAEEPLTPMPRPNSPDRLNPDWCRLRTGGTEILPGQDARAGVPLPGLAGNITSCTGPSYRPRGTPWISASCEVKRAGVLAS